MKSGGISRTDGFRYQVKKLDPLGHSLGPLPAVGRDHPVVGAPVFVHESGAMVSGLVWYTGSGNAAIVQALESVTQTE